MSIGKAKGSVLLHLRDFVERRDGQEAWRDVLDKVTPEDRSVLEGMVISGSWYPVEIWNRALDVYLPNAFRDADEGMASVAAYIADADLNRVFKMILQMGSPEFLMRRTSALWNRYFDAGKLEASQRSPAHWELELEVPHGYQAAPSYYTCGPGVAAWITSGLRRTGVDGYVDFEVTSARATRYHFQARWQKRAQMRRQA